MGKNDKTVFHKRKKLNLKVKQNFQIWLLVRIMGTSLITIIVASILLYLYSKGVVDAEYLSFKTDVRRVSEVLLPVLIAASLTSIVCGLVIALFLPQKIAGPLFRIEQDMLQVISKGDLTKSITLRCADILKEHSETINMTVGNIGNMVKDVKESGNALETKIAESGTDEIKEAFELHKEQLERIKTKS
jgi:methyl-accepting chemotaxis protein